VKTIRIRAHFDYSGYADDVEEFKVIIENLKAVFAGHNEKVKISFSPYERLEDCLESAGAGDVVVLDWGGLSGGGQSGFINHYERAAMRAFEENPSVLFIIWVTMPGFYDESFFEFKNVEAFDRCDTPGDLYHLLNGHGIGGK
jgi:hypothetical protein